MSEPVLVARRLARVAELLLNGGRPSSVTERSYACQLRRAAGCETLNEFRERFHHVEYLDNEPYNRCLIVRRDDFQRRALFAERKLASAAA